MAKYRKKPVEIEASQWFKDGDHPNVVPLSSYSDVSPQITSPERERMGWIDTLESGHVVTPGDWIITGVKGEHYPCKPDIFAATYEPVEATPIGDASGSYMGTGSAHWNPNLAGR